MGPPSTPSLAARDSSTPLPLHVLDPSLRPPASFAVNEVLHSASGESLFRSGNYAYMEVCHKLDEARRAYDKLLDAIAASSTTSSSMVNRMPISAPETQASTSDQPPLPDFAPASVVQQNPLDKPLLPSNYPAVPYWFEHQYSRRPLPSGERGIKLTLKAANKADLKTLCFVTNQDGTSIASYRIAEIRKACRSAMNGLGENAPATFTKLSSDLDLLRALYKRIYRQCPELCLCENNWKARVIVASLYSDWSHKTTSNIVPSKRANGVDTTRGSKKQKATSDNGLAMPTPQTPPSTIVSEPQDVSEPAATTAWPIQPPTEAPPVDSNIHATQSTCHDDALPSPASTPPSRASSASPVAQSAEIARDTATDINTVASSLLSLASFQHPAPDHSAQSDESRPSVTQPVPRPVMRPYQGIIRDPLTGQAISRASTTMIATTSPIAAPSENVDLPGNLNEDPGSVTQLAPGAPPSSEPIGSGDVQTSRAAPVRKRTGATLMRPGSSKTPRNLFAVDYFQRHPGAKITVAEFESIWNGISDSEARHWKEASASARKKT